MANKKKRLIIIDGNALIHRSFHALPPTMATKDGQMVNAVYGFTTVLIKAIRELKPDYIALTLDKKGPTFRHEEYKEYKATRVKAPDELYSQIPIVKQVATVFGIKIFEKEGFEADDLIGTISAHIDHNLEKIIVTGDMDTLQLVDDNTEVYTMSRGLSDSVVYDEKAVQERYELKPEQMIDYKGLRGDPSDNIPGVKGIGEKTATELLKEFKTLDELYEVIDSNGKKLEKIKPRILDLLKQYRDDAFLSKRLATIKRDVPIDFDLEQVKFGVYDKAELVKLFSELEFKSLLPRVQELGSSVQRPGCREEEKKEQVDKFERNKKLFKYYLVDSDEDFEKFLAKLKEQKEFVIDTETTSLDPLTTGLLGISFSWKEGEAYYINFQFSRLASASDSESRRAIFNFQTKKVDLFSYNKKEEAGFRQDWLEKLRPILENEKIKKYGHNTKFDLRVSEGKGMKVRGIVFDTMIAS
ncbi:MAG: 5'-3' exonuclease H3TH domain-containing protein, partial [Patescibacteria group bacterium]